MKRAAAVIHAAAGLLGGVAGDGRAFRHEQGAAAGDGGASAVPRLVGADLTAQQDELARIGEQQSAAGLRRVFGQPAAAHPAAFRRSVCRYTAALGSGVAVDEAAGQLQPSVGRVKAAAHFGAVVLYGAAADSEHGAGPLGGGAEQTAAVVAGAVAGDIAASHPHPAAAGRVIINSAAIPGGAVAGDGHGRLHDQVVGVRRTVEIHPAAIASLRDIAGDFAAEQLHGKGAPALTVEAAARAGRPVFRNPALLHAQDDRHAAARHRVVEA